MKKEAKSNPVSAEQVVQIMKDIEEVTASKKNHARACNDTLKDLRAHLVAAMREYEDGQMRIDGGEG